MKNVVLSLSNNLLKITNIDKDKLNNISAEISEELANGTYINNVKEFASVAKELMFKGIPGFNPSKYQLNISVEPGDVEMRFLTIPKSSDITEESVINEIKSRFSDLKLEDYYFSYEKIAPFVYQFLAVKKERMETYLQLSDILGMSLTSAVPWVLVLPKFVGTSNPGIFVLGEPQRKVVAVSELGGIFFNIEYDSLKTDEEISEMLKELSVYKRKKPIKDIYTVNCELNSFEGDYTVKSLDFGGGGNEPLKGYENNLIVQYILDNKRDLLDTNINLLNILPLPMVEKQETSVVKAVKVGVPALISVLAVFGVFMLYTNRRGLVQQRDTGSSEQVLSSNVSSPETGESTASVELPTDPLAGLQKSDIKVRIENGSGINGIAAKTKTLLEGLSYSILEIDTAEQNVDKTQLKFKKNKVIYKDFLIKDMSEDYGEVEVSDDLNPEASYDLLIVVGTSVSL